MIVAIINQNENISKLQKYGIEYSALFRSEKNEEEIKSLNPDVLICRNRDNIPKFVEDCPNLKMIFVVEVGLEKLPFDELISHNVRVAHTSGISADIMSNYSMACILSHIANLEEDFANKQKHFWKKFQCTDSLIDKTLLVAGAGRTGYLIAKKAKAFGMKTIGIVKNVRDIDVFDKVGALDKLDDSLEIADFVVCVMPLTPETKHLFNAKRFDKMKRNALFVNIARGALVCESDLLEAIEKQKIAKAFLDVFEVEPLPTDHPFWNNPNIIITPHQSGRLSDYMDRAMDIFAENYQAYCKGEKMPNEANLAQGY